MPLDDEDNPFTNSTAPNPNLNTDDAPEDGEDGMPDFKLFASMFSKKGISSKVIRKGAKDFESHGTRAQDSTLENSRRALEDVLSYTRVHRPDAWTRAWYFPEFWSSSQDDGEEELHDSGLFTTERVVVMEHEKGAWLKDCGRIIRGDKRTKKLGVGRTWMLPEEALHLLERGTLDIWWPDQSYEEILGGGHTSSPSGTNTRESDLSDYYIGLPLSLEAAYSFLIGEEGETGKISLPKYQVYAHLKRSGYIVLRAPPDSNQLTDQNNSPPKSLRNWLFSLITWPSSPNKQVPPYGPLVQPGLYRSYRSMYQNLSLIPRHDPTSNPPSSTSVTPSSPKEPFKIFYHVWKPGAPSFSKKNPPPPDFRIAVADTLDSFVPTLEEIDALLTSTDLDPPKPEWQGPGRMHQRLKHGHRNVLVAIVDAGLVNFMRFAEGAFGEEKIFERFDGGGNRGARKGGRGGRGGRGRGRGRGRR